MKPINRLFLLLILLSSNSLWADDDDGGQGGGEEQQASTRTFNIDQNSDRDVTSLNSSFQYITFLLPTLQMQISTSLGNSFNNQSNQGSQNRNLSGHFSYTPNDRWNYNIEYLNSYSHSLRQQSANFDRYEAESDSQSFNSSISYSFTDSLRNALSMGLSHNTSYSQIPSKPINRSEVSTRNITDTVTYAITTTTNFTTGITLGRTHTIYPEHNPEDPIPSDPIDPDLAGTILDLDELSINGSISDSRKILETIDLSTSFSHNESVGTSSNNPLYNNSGKTTNASAGLTWSPWDKLRFPLNLNYSDTYYYYTNLALERAIKEKEEGTHSLLPKPTLLDFYNSHQYSFGGDLRLEWDPASYARFAISGRHNKRRSDLFDENDGLPPAGDPKLYSLNRSLETGEYATLSIVMGEDITLSLSQHINEINQHYPANASLDNNKTGNGLGGTIAYELSPSLSATVATSMSTDYTNYLDNANDDSRGLSVNLSTDFTLKVLEGTKTTIGFTVSKSGSEMIDLDLEEGDPNPTYQETLTRQMRAGASRSFGIVDTSLNSSLSTTLSNRPTSIKLNTTTFNWSVTPTVTLRPTEKFYTNISTTIAGYKQTYPNDPDQELKNNRYASEYYSVTFNYAPTSRISIDLGAIWRAQRSVPQPIMTSGEKNTYLNTSSSVSVQF